MVVPATSSTMSEFCQRLLTSGLEPLSGIHLQSEDICLALSDILRNFT